MDIAVRRNAYGSQIDSFATKKVIPEVDSKEIELGVYSCSLYYKREGRGKKCCVSLMGISLQRKKRICW